MRRSIQLALLAAAAGLSMLALGAADPAAARARSAICTTEYIPVCALGRNGVRSTYSNACVARRARARILHGGECWGPFCPLFFIYDPVCARDLWGVPRTYSNVCTAENNNAVLLHKGKCR